MTDLATMARRPRTDVPTVVWAVAVIAALPSLVWAVAGASFLSDDWAVWGVLDRRGVLDGMWQLGFEQPARPLSAPYYAFVYLVLGDLPVLQGALIAAINAGLVVALWRLGRHLVPHRLLLPAVVGFALLPNHASTRLWFVVGTYPLALLLAALGLRHLVSGRAATAVPWLVASCVLYEGTVAFTVAVIVAWALPAVPERWRPAAAAAVPTVVVAALLFLLSPKRGSDGPSPFSNVSSLVPAQLGNGLWSDPLVAQVLGRGLLALVVFALATPMLPSFRTDNLELRWIRIGAGITLISAAPFVYAGAPFATLGVFDRNNLVPSVGTAIVLAGAWTLARERWPRLGATLALVVAAVFFAFSLVDVGNWRDAAADGERVLGSVARALEGVELDRDQLIVVVPEQPGLHRAVADFIYDGDLREALRYRTGERWERLVLVENGPCTSPGLRGGTVTILDWQRSAIEHLRAQDFVDGCDRWLDRTR